MKPPAFDYHRASSVAQTVQLLGELGDEAKILAGGQSLVAVMNLRLARPSALVDINEVPGLAHITLDGAGLRIGALTRHRDIELYPADLGGFELLRTASRFVGHYPIRTRGTFAGSIAHADPTAEWCLLVRLLDARVLATSPRGQRSIAAADMFHGFLTTELEPDEMITEVVFPKAPVHTGFAEYARRHGDFAIVAAAVGHELDDSGVVTPRLALAGVDSKVVRSGAGEEAMAEADPQDPSAAGRVGREAARAIDPPSDLHGDGDYRRHLAATMVRRALVAAGWANDGGGR